MARPKDLLTATAIRAAHFTGHPTKLFDGGGLFLLVNQSGKYWRLKYRFGGREKVLALGVYPTVSLKDARVGRDKARELLAKGIDPLVQRRATRALASSTHANTLESVGREWFESIHRHDVTDSHASRNLRRLERHIFPTLGHLPISEITAPLLLEALRRIDSQGHRETALRVRTLCSQVFRYAIRTERAERDPAADLRDALPAPVTHHLPAVVDPKEIGPLLRALDDYAGEPTTRAALQLTPLLFVRPGELRTAEWADFDLEAGTWNYKPSKGGAPLTTPLPRQAVEILRGLRTITGGNRYVFPSTRGKGRPMSNNTVNATLHRLGYKNQMTAHGFRAMARTVLVEQLNYPAEYVEMQLAHRVRDAMGRAYNRATYLEQRREMLQTWADYLDGLRRGEVITPQKAPS